ncbi:hypothetical protein O7635_20085 [Asanoa sp. WMMD1127]|uniref:hypothetical protein n=1 Tax=Asanoa sp. WMMD1127 TaxID=3016107 RepID=UPI0024177AA3|nr:hypothetical protein [Asanoa sp. WMMD1127]MDG4824157.1 hypothetical protein [Asanoa sp. WMMD1127]
MWIRRTFDANLGRGAGGGSLRDTTRTRSSTEPLWVVRLDWPAGDHEFGCPRSDETAAARELDRVASFWARGPMRPRLRLARISAHDFDLHAKARRGCKAPDCP